MARAVSDASAPLKRTAPSRRWPVVLGAAGGAFLGAVFLVGLYAKAIDPEAFVETIHGEGLDFLLPAGVVAGVALGLEALLGFCLVMGLRHLRVLWPSAALVAFFVFLTARAYITHDPNAALDDASCGCFGNLIQRSPAAAFWQDFLLLVPACALAFFARTRAGGGHGRARYLTAAGLTVGVLVFAWFAPGLPLDDLATRLRPGVRTSELCAGDATAEAPGEGPSERGVPEDGGAGDEGDGGGRVCLDDMIPELVEGEHVLVLADLDDPALHAHVPALNAYALDGEDGRPQLYLLCIATIDDVERFEFEQQPSFPVIEGFAAVLRPLYRHLPRSFLVRDGRVTQTWQGWPPLATLVGKAASGPRKP